MRSPEVLTRPTVDQTQRLQLTSPLLHIGSAVSELSPFEYVQVGRTIYLPEQDALAKALYEQDALAKALYEQGRLDDYIQAIADSADIAPLLEKALGPDWQDSTNPDGHPLFPPHRRLTVWTDKPIRKLRPMIRNGFGYPYIPGSSIKGAMRTAIAYYLLSHADQYKVPSNNRVSVIEQKLRQKLEHGELNYRGDQRRADDRLFMNDLFTQFSLFSPRRQQRPVRPKSGPNRDLMRTIQVTDSHPLHQKEDEGVNVSIANEVLVSSHTLEGDAKARPSPCVEMVHNLKTEFTLSLDTEMLSWFRHRHHMELPFQSVDDLRQICRAFAQAQWQAEQIYWDKIYDRVEGDTNLDFSRLRRFYNQWRDCPYDLRLGWACGMTGTTIHGLLPEDLRAEIRDTCGIKAPGFPAPKNETDSEESGGGTLSWRWDGLSLKHWTKGGR